MEKNLYTVCIVLNSKYFFSSISLNFEIYYGLHGTTVIDIPFRISMKDVFSKRAVNLLESSFPKESVVL